MSVCTFFGHRECYGLDREMLYRTIEGLICQGVDTFYVGNQGGFDAAVYGCLQRLREKYPHICIGVVLAYLPTQKQAYGDMADTVFPEGMELVPPKFAIDRRNRWMVDRADHVICCIRHSWGGAYRFAKLAKSRGKHVINISGADVAL